MKMCAFVCWLSTFWFRSFHWNGHNYRIHCTAILANGEPSFIVCSIDININIISFRLGFSVSNLLYAPHSIKSCSLRMKYAKETWQNEGDNCIAVRFFFSLSLFRYIQSKTLPPNRNNYELLLFDRENRRNTDWDKVEKNVISWSGRLSNCLQLLLLSNRHVVETWSIVGIR